MGYSSKDYEMRREMGNFLGIQKILVVNWIVFPYLGMRIWINCGFLSAILFVIIWLSVDKVWDLLTGFLIGVTGGDEISVFELQISGRVPVLVVLMMAIDILGTLLLPWVVAGFFLGFSNIPF